MVRGGPFGTAATPSRLATRVGLDTTLRSDVARFRKCGVVRTFRCADDSMINTDGLSASRRLLFARHGDHEE